METVIGWEVLVRQVEALIPRAFELDLLLRHFDDAHDLAARVWVDHGIRDEEGIPTEYELPTVYITLCSRFLGHWHGMVQNIPAAEIPIIAAALKPQIEAAVTEARDQVDAHIDRFSAIVQELKNQRSKLTENP